ncbi:hypothetical protein HYQ46_001210 [Verticillium longisporum]|nr:hypothetical protein HYQ46_001210 [Verticillium longisporum]
MIGNAVVDTRLRQLGLAGLELHGALGNRGCTHTLKYDCISFRHDESDCCLAWGLHPSSSRGNRIPSTRVHHPDPTSLSLFVAPLSCSGHLFLALVLGRLVLASGLACLGWSGAERRQRRKE